VRKHPTTIEHMIIWGLLAFGLIMLNGGSVIGDNPPVSRWARVDITQYCDKTVGELIDALGNDYIEFRYQFSQYFAFEYNDATVLILPDEMKFYDDDWDKEGLKMADIRKAHIALIKLLVKAQEER
jgi:hypothetical protein